MSVISRLLPTVAPPTIEGSVINSYLLYILQCCYLYGYQIVILTVLSAMAAFRREMSSNRVYMEHHQTARNGRECSDGESGTEGRSVRPRLVILDQDVTDIDNMLEGAGYFCSGGPLLSLVLAVWARVALARFRVSPDEEAENPEIVGHDGSIGSASMPVGQLARSTERMCPSSSKKDEISATNNRRHRSSEVPGGNENENGNESKRGGDGGSKCANLKHEDRKCGAHSTTMLDLPPDAHIHVLSFLHPHDVVTFACASRGAHSIVNDETTGGGDGHSTSLLLWKELWKRDYAWIVTEWDVGREALSRSRGRPIDSSNGTAVNGAKYGLGRKMNSVFRHLESSIVDDDMEEEDSPSYTQLQSPAAKEVGMGGMEDMEDINLTLMSMKDFYFTFGETWLNYTIAGRNTSSRCLVGLHGHVFDITGFFEQHPGSPETLLVQSGRDATSFFEDLGHSVGARKMAMTFCVVLDRASVAGNSGKGCGLLRTGKKGLASDKSSARTLPKTSWARSNTARNAMPMVRSKPRRPGTLHRIRVKVDREERQEQIKAEKWLSRTLTCDGILGNIHVYYDVFVGRWMPWYTDLDFNPVYLDRVSDA